MKTTRTIACTCKHEFQDRVYGLARRLGNLVTKSVKPMTSVCEYRCTVCGKSHQVNK